MSKEKEIVLKIFTKRVGDHPYRETALKYLGLAMDKVKFPTKEGDEEIEEYCESVRKMASLILAKNASEQIFKKYPSTDEDAKQRLTEYIASTVCVKENGDDFAELFFKHFKPSLVGISTLSKRTEFIVDKNAYESVVDDFLSLYTFNAQGLKEAYRKEFKESFPVEKIEEILKSSAECQVDKVKYELEYLGRRACNKFLIQEGESDLPHPGYANAAMEKFFVKPVYDDIRKTSQIVLNSMLYRL